MNVRRALSVLIAAGAVTASAPGWATNTDVVSTGDKLTYTIDLTGPNSNGSTGNTRTFNNNVATEFNDVNVTTTSGGQKKVGNTVITDLTSDLNKLDLTASGWSMTRVGTSTEYSIQKAALGQWDQGLGVTNSNDNGGSGNQHQIDNSGTKLDFIMLEFDRGVTLESITRQVFALYNSNNSCTNTNCVKDSDAAYKATLATRDSLNFAIANGQTPKTISTTWTAVPGNSVSGKTVLDATQVSSTWLVGASFDTSGTRDGFKLKDVTVSWNAVVPEPSTWAMMIVGFGFVGCALRRQRRIAATA